MEDDPVQLGFLSKNSASLSTDIYISKVGGKPIWPSCIPKIEQLTCNCCNNPLRYLLQISAPLLDISIEYRILYLFACVRNSCKNNIIVLRYQPKQQDSDNNTTKQENTETNLCFVCNIMATKSCSKCHKYYYCSTYCQKLHWNHSKHPHKSECNNNSKADYSVTIFDEFIINIEEEELPDDFFDNKAVSDNKDNKDQEEDEDDLTGYKPADGNKDLDIDDFIQITNKMKNNSILESKDKSSSSSGDEPSKTDLNFFKEFQRYIKVNPGQILRYYPSINYNSPDSGILWLNSNYPSLEEISKCPKCHSERILEFQILPQLLYYLKVDSLFPEDTLDWGILSVYTCKKSCNTKGFVEEYVHKQIM